MFKARYFRARYFGSRYLGNASGAVTAVTDYIIRARRRGRR